MSSIKQDLSIFCLIAVVSCLCGCGSHSNPVGPSGNSTATPASTPVATPNATQTAISIQATQTAAGNFPPATQTAVVVQATQTAVAVIATQTAVVVAANETTVAVHATQTTVAVVATETAVAGSGATTTQVLWKNGVLASQWWGQPLTMFSSPSNSFSTVSVTDGISGDSSVLAISQTISGDIASSIFFEIPYSNAFNASNYASGHIQFDLKLGPAFSAGEEIIGEYNAGGCIWPSISGLNQTSFTHISVPISTGICNTINGFWQIVILDENGSGSTGIQFYIDNLQITSN
ncbi:MAG TPA: hypothetical protein VK914_05795 [bacterium]|jgi:hypothetical protein|nr:hypothetical protein [bacterium]